MSQIVVPRIPRWFAAVVVVAVAVGGFFFPVLGLIVPVFILAGALSAMAKPRAFCTHACPRGRSLPLLARFSAYRPLPKALRSPGLRTMGCALMMGCSFLQMSRIPATWAGAADLGRFFWGMCVATLALGTWMAIRYKPRSWCAVCPMGTLQDTVSAQRAT